MSDFLNYNTASGDEAYIVLRGHESSHPDAVGEFVFAEWIPRSDARPYMVLLAMSAESSEILASIVLDFGLSKQAPCLYLHPYLFQSLPCKEVMHMFADFLSERDDALPELIKHWCNTTGGVIEHIPDKPVGVIQTELTIMDDDRILADKALTNQILDEFFDAKPPPTWFVLEDYPDLIAYFEPQSAGTYSDFQAEWHDRSYMALRTEPDWLFMVIEKLLSYYDPNERAQGSKFYFAYLVILRESLYRLGVDLARGFNYADWLNNKLQRHLVDNVLVPEVGQLLQQDLIDALARSRLPITDAFKEAQFNLADYYGRFQKDRNLPDLGRYLEDLNEDGLTSIFDIFEHFVSHLRLMLPEERFFFIEEMARTQHVGVQELVGLFNLHPDPKIRAALRQQMSHFVGPNWVSPITLRRMILIRNWLPEKERPALDRLIKLNRMARVDCESTNKAELRAIFASSVDGAGSCAFWLFSQQDDQFFHSHIMLKQREGVQESWFITLPDAQTMEQEIQSLRETPEFGQVDQSYLSDIIGHFLALGHHGDHVPHASALQVVERVGDLDWQPQELTLNTLKEFCDRYDALPSKPIPDELLPVLHALPQADQGIHYDGEKPSGIYQYRGLETWFDESQELEDFLRQRFGEPIHWMYRVFEVAGDIADHVLEKNRDLWRERFMLNAFFFLFSEKLESPLWRMYAQDARAIAAGCPLSQIPVLQNVAIRSLQAAFDRNRFSEAWQEILKPKTVPFPFKKKS